MRGHAAYSKAQSHTASKERILVLLFQAAQKHMRHGATALEAGRRDEATRVLLKASDIVVELMSTLDAGQAPELCSALGEVYSFVALRLTKGMSSGDAAPIKEAERAFAPLVDAFEQAVAQVSAGQAQAAAR